MADGNRAFVLRRTVYDTHVSGRHQMYFVFNSWVLANASLEYISNRFAKQCRRKPTMFGRVGRLICSGRGGGTNKGAHRVELRVAEWNAKERPTLTHSIRPAID